MTSFDDTDRPTDRQLQTARDVLSYLLQRMRYEYPTASNSIAALGNAAVEIPDSIDELDELK